MDPIILLAVVGTLALLIIIATAIAVIRILRQPEIRTATQTASSAATVTSEALNTPTPAVDMAETIPLAEIDDINTYLDEQRANLIDFELSDLSNSFRGTTQEGQRMGMILHITDSEIGLVAFTGQAFNPQSGVVTAETTYGAMELVITQGRAGVKWGGEPLGILDYTNRRILGPEGQLLGSMDRPPASNEDGYYPVGFLGQKVADVTTQINALSTLRWFGNENEDQLAAFQDMAPDLEDNQTLLLLATFLLEIGFLNLL